jgi:tape measure domain-containing protein
VADAKFEEAIRLAFETSGTEGIKQAAGIIANLSGVSEEAKQHAAALLDEIGATEKTGKAVNQYQQLGKSVLDYQRQINEAKAKVVELANAQKEGDVPTKAQERELAKARTTLSTLVGEQQREIEQLRTLKTQIEGQGVSLRNAGAAQRDLATHSATASANLRTLVGNLRATREAEASNQAELAASAAKARSETAQYDAALKKVRQQLDENKHASVEGSKSAVEGLEKTRGMLERLREPLAALGAFFSFEALKEGVKSIFETGSKFEEFEQRLTSLYGTAEQGKSAFDWVKDFTTRTPLTLDQTMSAFVRLKKFGIDPMGGALQAVVDQNAKLAGGSEQLEAITTALAKATAKGKLEMRGLIQLTEAGVPAFDILGKVLGKSADEVRILAEQGRIGADVMQKFITQMGKDAAGGAQRELEQLASQWTVFTENVDEFRDRTARKGVMDFFRDQLKGLNELITRMAANGQLDEWAQKISNSIISVAKSVKSATLFLYDHAAAISAVAKVYATFKVARIAGELAIAGARFAEMAASAVRAGSAVEGTAGKVGLLGRTLGRLPGTVQVAIAVVGFQLLKTAGEYIGELAAKHSEAAKSLEATQKRVNAEIRKQAEAYMVVEEQYGRFYDTQVLGTKEVAKLTAAERASYAARLDGLQAYLQAKAAEQRRLVQLGEIGEEELGKTMVALRAAKEGMTSLQQGAELAASAIKSKLSLGAEDIRKQMVGLGNDASTAQTRIGELFASFQSDSVTDIGDIALALARIASESQKSDIVVRNGLQGTLNQLSSTDLLKFQSASTAAFAQYNIGAKESAAVTETVLQLALEHLGVAADRWGLAVTDAARQNVAAFQTVAENASATAGTIEAAFSKALANASTVEAVQDLGTAMQVAGQQGKVGFDATERAAAAVQNRIRSLKTALDPLNEAFAKLGVSSKRSLDDAAAASRTAFDQIVHAYRNGGAAIEDVRAAFGSYAKSQLDAAANSDAWKQSSVRNALEVQAATLSVSGEMARLGLSGLDAGDKVSHGAVVASDALHGVAHAARDAADATAAAGDSAEQYGEKAGRAADESSDKWVATGKRTSYALNGLSNTFLQALSDLNKYASTQNVWRNMWNNTVAEWRRQGAAVDELVAKLDKQNAVYDEIQQRVETLRKTYNYLNDDQLRALAQAQKTLADNQKRAEDEAKQQRADRLQKAKDEAEKQTAEWDKELGIGADSVGRGKVAPGPDGVHRVALDLNVSASQTPGAVPAQLSPTDVQKVANEVVRQIGVARTMSNR